MKQARTLSSRDIKRTLNHCSTRKHAHRDTVIVQFSILAGLRAIELAALTVGDVYAVDGTVMDQFTLGAAQTKGNDARRVHISSKLKRILAGYWSAVEHRHAQEPLFQTQLRTSFSANTMCQLFLDIYNRAGIKDASSHSGRRTFITRLAEQGVGVRVLAALAGHKHISTTQRYIDVNDAQLASAVELI